MLCRHTETSTICVERKTNQTLGERWWTTLKWRRRCYPVEMTYCSRSWRRKLSPWKATQRPKYTRYEPWLSTVIDLDQQCGSRQGEALLVLVTEGKAQCPGVSLLHDPYVATCGPTHADLDWLVKLVATAYLEVGSRVNCRLFSPKASGRVCHIRRGSVALAA